MELKRLPYLLLLGAALAFSAPACDNKPVIKEEVIEDLSKNKEAAKSETPPAPAIAETAPVAATATETPEPATGTMEAPEAAAPKPVVQITKDKMHEMGAAKDVLFVNVCNEGESFEAAKYLPQKQLVAIPLPKIESGDFQLDNAKRIITVCKSGQRSMKAAELLAAKGYEVYNVEGGLGQ
jgi:rhodanese-related sulfurtransferase